jgi:hypothetical protein
VYSKHVDKVRMVRNRSRPGCIGRWPCSPKLKVLQPD